MPAAISDGVGGLVDVDVLEELRRILVEFDAAVVAGGDLLAAVEQRRREVGPEAADRQVLVAPVEALRGNAGQAGERVGDRYVGQLADVFGRDRFDDQNGVALDLGRVGEAGAEAGDDDFIVCRWIGHRCAGRPAAGSASARRMRGGVPGWVVAADVGSALGVVGDVAWPVCACAPRRSGRTRARCRAASGNVRLPGYECSTWFHPPRCVWHAKIERRWSKQPPLDRSTSAASARGDSIRHTYSGEAAAPVSKR